MRVIEAGRLVFPEGAKAARELAEQNLLSIHSRYRRLSAIAGRVDLGGEAREVANPSPLSIIADERSASAIAEVIPNLATDAAEWLVLRDYEDGARTRSILFTFDDGRLSSVVKLRPLEEGGAALKNEAEVLDHLHASATDALTIRIPKVVAFVSTDRYEVLVLSPVAGQPLWMSMQRSLRPVRSHGDQLAAVGAWLGRFHRETGHSESPHPTDVPELGDVLLDGTPAGQRVIVHGDLWARNILFDSDRKLSGIVDWERASLRGPRWHDLFTLPLLFVLHSPGWRSRDLLDRFGDGFLSDSPAAEVVRKYLDEYVRESRLENGVLRPMFEAFLAGAEDESGKEEHGWRKSLPWRAMRALLRTADRTVFSG